MRKKGFTLVEIMVALSILGLGVVLIARSFLSTVSVLDSLKYRTIALDFLSSKMNTLEEQSLNDNGIKKTESEEQVFMSNREATFKLQVTAIDIEEMKDSLNIVTLSLNWTEGDKQKYETLITYLPNKN